MTLAVKNPIQQLPVQVAAPVQAPNPKQSDDGNVDQVEQSGKVQQVTQAETTVKQVDQKDAKVTQTGNDVVQQVDQKTLTAVPTAASPTQGPPAAKESWFKKNIKLLSMAGGAVVGGGIGFLTLGPIGALGGAAVGALGGYLLAKKFAPASMAPAPPPPPPGLTSA